MVDLVVIAVVVTPAIPVGILRGVGAAEMIDAVRLPTLRVDLRPFHHGIAVKEESAILETEPSTFLV